MGVFDEKVSFTFKFLLDTALEENILEKDIYWQKWHQILMEIFRNIYELHSFGTTHIVFGCYSQNRRDFMLVSIGLKYFWM